jgi:phosphatidylinositol-3-phosphatase
MPFLAVGPGVKANYAGAVSYTHSSLVKSVERILALPILSTVSGSNDFTDLFNAGFFP